MPGKRLCSQIVTDVILEQSPSKCPHTGEDKVNLIKFPRRVSRSVMVCQQAFQQGTQRLIGRKHRNKSTCQNRKEKCSNNKRKDSFIHEVRNTPTCTMLFSGIGVMVLRLQRTCSKQYGTYLSNKIVRLARSDWAFLVSIQLATYLKKAYKTS